jgi:hypothetical protein
VLLAPHQQPGERVGADRHVSLDRAEFIAGEGMLHILPTLETPDPQTRVIEISGVSRIASLTRRP